MKPPDLVAMRHRMDQRREEVTRKAEGAMLRFHRDLYVRSEGRVGKMMLRVPSLLLTVKGRSTGNEQTVALVYATTEGSEYVVVASNGRQDHNPDWFENLRSNPAVSVQIGRQQLLATAEVVDRNDRRYEPLWRLVNENNHGRYYRYQHSTKRAIPLVLLQPV